MTDQEGVYHVGSNEKMPEELPVKLEYSHEKNLFDARPQQEQDVMKVS